MGPEQDRSSKRMAIMGNRTSRYRDTSRAWLLGNKQRASTCGIQGQGWPAIGFDGQRGIECGGQKSEQRISPQRCGSSDQMRNETAAGKVQDTRVMTE